ncbi:type III polyketide synthase [Streptomyces sp. P1-3]|uniref:type III polyketide synthase n=1 Tax=Streptomyces sp. P1-3 TaxID=3421658 RepID=UPI003D35B13C
MDDIWVPRITGFGVALPSIYQSQAEIPDFLPDDYPKKGFLQKVVAHCGIEGRYLAVDPIAEDVRNWSTGARMSRHLDEALPLSEEAVATALKRTSLDADDIGLLCLVSSTGYVTPGVDTGIARDFGMAPDTKRVSVGHMGCFAALPALEVCADFVRHNERPALMINVELSSLHLQPPPYDNQQVVVSSLFADAAVATVVQHEQRRGGWGLEVVDVTTRTDAEHEDCMSWTVTDKGFRMGLSPQVPGVVGTHLPGMVRELLGRRGLDVSDVGWWAIHPGGPAIIDAAVNSLELDPAAADVSRRVLHDYGNCASAGVLMVMEALQSSTPLETGKHGIAVAFGPGLTIYAALVRGT